MPKKRTNPLIQCANFTWRLICRDGVFYADGRSGETNLGKHSLGTRSEAEAKELLKVLDEHKAVELGKKLAVPTTSLTSFSLSIEDGWERYLAFARRPPVMKGASEGTIKRYRAVRDHHLRYCRKHGITNWVEFDKNHLEKFADQRTRKRADRTVYLELTTLKSISKWLVGEKLIPADCLLRYSLSKPDGTDTYCYHPDEVATMISHCTSKPNLVWLANLIVLLAHTGMRIGEAVGLRWSDIHLSAGVIRIADERSSRRKKSNGSARTTKGRRSRTIPIHTRLREMLSGLKRQPDGLVLHSLRGRQLLARNVLATFIDEVIEPLKGKFPTPERETGFEHGRIHSFRHFFCSQSFLGGASEGEVRDWLGHADSKITNHYRHLRSDDAVRRMERIEFLPSEDERPSDDAAYTALKKPDADDDARQQAESGRSKRRRQGGNQDHGGDEQVA
jgi:integrase